MLQHSFKIKTYQKYKNRLRLATATVKHNTM